MVTIQSAEGTPFDAYLALPPAGQGPGIVLIQEIFGINAFMRETADWLAGKGYVVACPDLFWRQEPGIQLDDRDETDCQRAFALYEGLDVAQAVADLGATLKFLRQHAACTGRVGAVGYCLGGKLAYLLAVRHDPDCAVGYYGVGIEQALDEAPNLTGHLMLHLAGADAYCDAAARTRIHEALDDRASVVLCDYPGQEHAFARKGGEHFDAAAAELANLRTLDFLHHHLCHTKSPHGPAFDLAAIWEEHVKYEFQTRNYQDTLDTMVEDAYVNHIPTLTGGVGKEQLAEFYSRRFIPQMPPDTEMTPVSRTVGKDRIVDEMIFKFTHTIEMDWMLPGIAPTGKRVEVPLVAIVHIRGDKLAHEHIYWDQASVLVQLGLIDADKLPVMGAETAAKVLDNSIPSNALIQRADRRRS